MRRLTEQLRWLLRAGLILAGPTGLLVNAGPINGPRPTTSSPQSHQAVEALRQGDPQKALQILRQASQSDPEMSPAEIELATIYLNEGQVEKCRNLLEQAAVLHPQDPEPHLLFADMAWRQRRLSDAHVQYDAGARLATDFSGSPERKRKLQVWALAGKASVAETRGQLETAQKLFSALLALDPAHPQGRYRLGHVLFAMGQPDKALQEFRAAADVVPTAPSPTLTLANLYRQSGDFQQAQHWIEQAVSESPTAPEPLVSMARLLLEFRNDPDAAHEFINRATELDPESMEPALLSGLVAWHQGKRAEAEKVFEALTLRAPDNTVINSYLAEVLAERGGPDRLARAWELARLTASINEASIDAAATLGWVAFYLGRFEYAEKQLRIAAGPAGARRDVKYYLARTLFRRGKVVEAQQALAEAFDAPGLFIHLRDARRWRDEIIGAN